jgi:predicted 3-demethylubiquinone-9 3-methyltransferase (glyoxalase superfamily)
MQGEDKAGADRVLKAMLQMKRIDVAKLEEAYKG